MHGNAEQNFASSSISAKALAKAGALKLQSSNTLKVEPRSLLKVLWTLTTFDRQVTWP